MPLLSVLGCSPPRSARLGLALPCCKGTLLVCVLAIPQFVYQHPLTETLVRQVSTGAWCNSSKGAFAIELCRIPVCPSPICWGVQGIPGHPCDATAPPVFTMYWTVAWLFFCRHTVYSLQSLLCCGRTCSLYLPSTAAWVVSVVVEV